MWYQQDLIKSQDRIPDPYQQKMRRFRRTLNQTSIAHYLNVLGTGSMTPCWHRLTELNLPILLVTGEEDEKFTAIAQEMEDLISHANRITIPDAGHAACFEQPTLFANALDQFINENTDA